MSIWLWRKPSTPRRLAAVSLNFVKRKRNVFYKDHYWLETLHDYLWKCGRCTSTICAHSFRTHALQELFKNIIKIIKRKIKVDKILKRHNKTLYHLNNQHINLHIGYVDLCQNSSAIPLLFVNKDHISRSSVRDSTFLG